MCKKWVHHDNRLKCSGLTDFEFQEHTLNEFKPFECDHCIGVRVASENNSIFVKLPFPVECEGNIFGKPPPIPKPDVLSMSPDQLKKFVKQCDEIKNYVTKSSESEDDEWVSSARSRASALQG